VTPNRFKVLVLSYRKTPHAIFGGGGGWEISPNFDLKNMILTYISMEKMAQIHQILK
jgi:hypothetical protein